MKITRMKLQERNYKHVVTLVCRKKLEPSCTPHPHLQPKNTVVSEIFEIFLNGFGQSCGLAACNGVLPCRVVGRGYLCSPLFLTPCGCLLDFAVFPLRRAATSVWRVCLDRLGILRHLFWMAGGYRRGPPLKGGGPL